MKKKEGMTSLGLIDRCSEINNEIQLMQKVDLPEIDVNKEMEGLINFVLPLFKE